MELISPLQEPVSTAIGLGRTVYGLYRTNEETKATLKVIIGELKSANRELTRVKNTKDPIILHSNASYAFKLAWEIHDGLVDICVRQRKCLFLWIFDIENICGDLNGVESKVGLLNKTIHDFKLATRQMQQAEYNRYMQEKKLNLWGNELKGRNEVILNNVMANGSSMRKQAILVNNKVSSVRNQVCSVKNNVQNVQSGLRAVGDRIDLHDAQIEGVVRDAHLHNRVLMEIMLENGANMSSRRQVKMGKKNLANSSTDLKAFIYFRTAAQNKYKPAYGWIAHCYHHGKGTGRNLELAARWYAAAAKGGTTWYMVKLGKLLLFEMNPNRRPEGIRWLAKAARNGDSEAVELLRRFDVA